MLFFFLNRVFSSERLINQSNCTSSSLLACYRWFAITKRQRELNNDLGSYLDQRKGSSQSFFKRVESLIPKFSSSDDVPEVSDIDATVVEDRPKKRSFFWFLFSRAKARDEEYDEEDLEEIEHVEEELENIEHQEEELEDEFEELEEKRESLLQRLFSFLSGKNKRDEEYEYEDEYEGEDVDDAASIREQETRTTLKIIHKWIGRLPPEQIDAFKRSPDFQKYKDLLELYNLIK